MIEFIKKIFKKWFGIFSLISSISGLFLFYTGIDTNNIIVKLLTDNWLIISLIFLLISSYQVWFDMKNEKIKLEDKLKNPIDYEIKAYKQCIDIDLNYIENIFDEVVKEINETLPNINDEIKKLSTNSDSNTERFDILLRISPPSFNNYKSDELYLIELKNYKHELEEYINNKNTFLFNWDNFIKNLKDIYNINFTIKNIGTVFDEDIDIKIIHEDKYISDISELASFPKLPSIPKKPEREIVTISHQSRDYHGDIAKMQIAKINSDPLTYRRYQKINKNNFSIKLRDLKISIEIPIFEGNGFFMNIENEKKFKVSISSKKSNAKIEKNIIFIETKNYNYFENKKI